MSINENPEFSEKFWFAFNLLTAVFLPQAINIALHQTASQHANMFFSVDNRTSSANVAFGKLLFSQKNEGNWLEKKAS